MSFDAVLIANRGEIAIRVARAAAELGLRSVAVYAEDDARALHVRRADSAVALRGVGPAAYLDMAQLVAAARDSGCGAIHPGYGFLSESAAFAARCADAGLAFVGPSVAALDAFGDKAKARALAEKCGVPVLRGTNGPTSLADVRAFFAQTGALMIKAIAGGGGRGMRAVARAEELEEAYARCRSEAEKAFGVADVYAEEWLPRARHLEVQLVGDGTGAVSHVWERECSVQRRHQKIVELAPSPRLDADVRAELLAAAVKLGQALRYRGLGTIEFLLDADDGNDGRKRSAQRGEAERSQRARFAFIEANARLQVEHTVTEAVTGIDLVRAQLEIARGATLAQLGLAQAQIPAPRGHAIQLRICTETISSDGGVKPAGGTLAAFDPPSGPGVRVDHHGYAGYTTNPRYDSLLAKLIVHAPSAPFADAIARADRALAELRVEGVATNAAFLRAILRHPDFAATRVTTRFVDEHAAELVAAAATAQPRRNFDSTELPAAAPRAAAGRGHKGPGAKLATADPLAVLDYGKGDRDESSTSLTAEPAPAAAAPAPAELDAPAGSFAVRAPLQGTIVSVDAAEGAEVAKGQQLLVMEAMKMEHVIAAPASGIVRAVAVARGDTVFEGHALLFLEEAEVAAGAQAKQAHADPNYVRPDLAEVFERHALTLDERRPDSVARRRKTGQRTARENVNELLDAGSYIEYAPLVVAAQRRRRSMDDLIANTPADGMVAGIGSVNGDQFTPDKSRCVVMSYDYTVLAGTQGGQNHRKKDRLFELAERMRLPVVFFAEGGGGRPGDTDGIGGAGLDCLAFQYWGQLSGLVPLVGITSGFCFAGNAAILGCCDVVIATKGSNIGMGGPAMIEGGGLGIFRPQEVGPLEVQVRNGVVDVAVEDEREAVRVAKQYLAYFQGPLARWDCADQRLLRRAIPENRLRIYDVRHVIATLADAGSVLELRRGFGHGMVTAFARIEGRPVGIVANNPAHLAGAIDSEAADKAARFLQLCDAFDVPVVFLCDTPGIMVGPEVEKTGLVRHASRLFVIGGSLTVPFMTIVLRKGYGLGAQAMAGGSFKAPIFTIAWPTGEFGGMGLEGAVKLGYRKELAAETDPDKRKALFDQMVKRMYDHGKAVSTASTFEIDDVIDPADSRRWISRALAASPAPLPRAGKKRPCVDTW
ncbi:MAG: carboxyl transferase domain-containing protein [Myxococcota bacterium]